MPPGVLARVFVIVASVSLTSCPHQGDALRLILRSVAQTKFSKSKRAVRRLVVDTASKAEHLTGPQIVAPPYHADVAVPSAVATRQESEPKATEQATSELEETRANLVEAHSTNTPPASSAEAIVYSIGRETQVYAEPRFEAKRVGYLRFGARVRRTSAAVSRAGCSGGWVGVQPTGYVCVNGRTATTDPHHPLVQIGLEGPDRMVPLPFGYAIAKRGVPRLFGFVPTVPERSAKRVSTRFRNSFPRWQTTSDGDWWRSPHEIYGYQRSKDAARLGDGLFGGGVALLGFLEDAGTLYGITPELELITTDALEPVSSSTFSGKALGGDESLPVAFAMSSASWLYRGDPRSGNPQPTRRLSRREAVFLTNERHVLSGQEWRSTKDGFWLRSSGLRIVEARSEWPDWVRNGAAWVDVSINQQTLVAYEGTWPRYVTLVSTGVDGLDDPATTKSTKTGVFHIVSKHLTATMNGEDEDGAYEMREVPWVQYFSQGYALHGAYWHDGFGQPRSHGCVNLSPIDARWLFHFTAPGVPANWHGAMPSERSATVFVHP